MKFIGNQIYQWISRFRNDVYLEDLSTSTEQSYLVVDSEGKITKRTTLNSGSNDITTTGDVNSTNVIITGEIRGPATTVIDPAPVGDNNGVLQIKGDLQVDGTTTTINSTTLTVDDKNIVLSSGSTTSLASDGAGITIDGASATLTYAHSDTSWNFNKPLNVSGDVKTDSNIIIPSDGFLKTSNNNFNFIELYNGSDASMRFRMGHSSVGRFQFLNSSDTEVFTIDARNERVGIGTTSPNRTLTIDTTSSNAMEIRRSGTRRIMSDASGSNGGWVFTGSGGNKFAVGAMVMTFKLLMVITWEIQMVLKD